MLNVENVAILPTHQSRIHDVSMENNKRNLPFSKVFHLASKNGVRGHVPISQDSSTWPQEWITRYFKNYPRMEKIQLESGTVPNFGIDTLLNRESKRDFSNEGISLPEIGTLLAYACGEKMIVTDTQSTKRTYPSGGGRYPIEIYPLVLREGTGLPCGLYHYNVRQNALDVLSEENFSEEAIEKMIVDPLGKHASILLIFSSVFWRSQVKYNERGYRYILIEAGHIGQNVYLVSEALGLKCFGMGGFNDGELEKLIDIDGVNESVIYTLALGK